MWLLDFSTFQHSAKKGQQFRFQVSLFRQGMISSLKVQPQTVSITVNMYRDKKFKWHGYPPGGVRTQPRPNNPFPHVRKPAHISSFRQTAVLVFVLAIRKWDFVFYCRGHLVRESSCRRHQMGDTLTTELAGSWSTCWILGSVTICHHLHLCKSVPSGDMKKMQKMSLTYSFDLKMTPVGPLYVNTFRRNGKKKKHLKVQKLIICT